MKKLWRLLAKDLDETETRKAIDMIPETVIEDIILDEQKIFGKVRNTTTRFLRSKYGSEIVDRTLWRISKRRQRNDNDEPEDMQDQPITTLTDLFKRLKAEVKSARKDDKNTL